MDKEARLQKNYEIAREKYAEIGVDTDQVIDRLSQVSLSLHCWQGDDVGGFEVSEEGLSGGIQVTGNHPGKARNPEELRRDMDKAMALIPGSHCVNLHSIYGDFGGKAVDRDQMGPEHFQTWIDWARERGYGMDFNSTCFSHPKAASGYTVASKDKGIRDFWKEHVKRCREISAHMGRELHSPAIHNFWIPDGSKDMTVDRSAHRAILKESLDDIFKTDYPLTEMKDSVESKLFGIGSESYVVGSHEFYMGYAIQSGKLLCLDMGHFHPTESVADKISAVLLYVDELMLHVSRGIRWDSDHVVTYSDDTRQLFEEIVRAGALDRVNIGLDFFDGSINRVGAWALGSNATLKALLNALLEPREKLLACENEGKNYERLALLEELKTMPLGDVWAYHCMKQNTKSGIEAIEEISTYEKEVLLKR